MRSMDSRGDRPKAYSSRLEALFDATTMATALFSFEDGRFLAANVRCKHTLHITDEMIEHGVDTSMVGLVTEERTAVRTMLETKGAAREVEMTLERPGHAEPTTPRRVPGRARRRQRSCVVSNFIDITRRRQLRQELQTSQDQMRLFWTSRRCHFPQGSRGPGPVGEQDGRRDIRYSSRSLA